MILFLFIYWEVWYVPIDVGYLENELYVAEIKYIPSWNVTKSQESRIL